MACGVIAVFGKISLEQCFLNSEGSEVNRSRF